MRNTIIGFDVGHNRFTLASLFTHITQGSQNNEFYYWTT